MGDGLSLAWPSTLNQNASYDVNQHEGGVEMQEQGFWLSPQQKFIWTIEQEVLRAPSRAVCLASFRGGVDIERLRGAIHRLVNRHEILRTVFRRQTGMKVPFQVVLESCEFGWQHDDLSQLKLSESQRQLRAEEMFEAARNTSSSRENGTVLKARLLSGTESSHLILSVPSLCADARSLQILLNELGAIYSGKEASLAEPFRYLQFAQWQTDLLESDEEDIRKGKDFWAKRQITPLDATLPSERKSEQSFSPHSYRIVVDRALASQVPGAGSTVILLSVWETLLSRLSGQGTFSVGFQVNGREYAELENAVGCFARTVPLRAQVENNFRFADVLRETAQNIRDVTGVQEYFAPDAIGRDGSLCSFSYQDLGGRQQFDGLGLALERIHVVGEPYNLRLVAVRR